MSNLTENLSKKLHKIWSNWYKYQRDNSVENNISRWEIQSNTDYSNLTEEDKEKDRKIVRDFFSDVIEELTELKEENAKLKYQNKRLREIIEVCQRYFDNQRVTDAWADNIKMDIDDSMSDLGMEKII